MALSPSIHLASHYHCILVISKRRCAAGSTRPARSPAHADARHHAFARARRRRVVLRHLEVSPDATAAEIRRAYRALAVRYHPDKNPTGGEMFRRIAEAYEL